MFGSRLTTRHKIYLVAIIALIALYAVRYSSFDRGIGGVSSASLAQLEDDIDTLKVRQAEAEGLRRALDTTARQYWIAEKQIPANEIQEEIYRIGMRNGLQLNRLGAPRVITVSENLDGVEVSVSAMCNMAQLGTFMQEIDNHSPAFEWISCSIRPNNVSNPTAINFNAKIRAVVVRRETLVRAASPSSATGATR